MEINYQNAESIVHAYFNVDKDVLWDTIQVDLPTLMKAITPYIGEKEEKGDKEEE